MTETTPAKDFLSVAAGAKDVALVIAKNKKELKEFVLTMDQSGLDVSKSVWDLLSQSKTYIVLDEHVDKDVYDFAVQYPTGQVEIFDQDHMHSQVLAPEYGDRCVVFVLTDESLKMWQKNGFNLLTCTGMAYRT